MASSAASERSCSATAESCAATGARLDRLAWWDWSHDGLRDALDDFRALDIAAFLAKHEGRR